MVWHCGCFGKPVGLSGHCFGDAGPGVEVPGDPPSQGRDSVNVSGHAIPAVLYGNQYAVLYDAETTES